MINGVYIYLLEMPYIANQITGCYEGLPSRTIQLGVTGTALHIDRSKTLYIVSSKYMSVAIV